MGSSSTMSSTATVCFEPLQVKSLSEGLAAELSSFSFIGVFQTGATLSTMDFANFWKMDGPVESCSDYTPESTQSCNDMVRIHY